MKGLKFALLRQKYSNNVIEKGIDKAFTREELKNVRNRKNNNLITFMSTHNPKYPEMFITIQQNLSILHERMK